MADDPQPSQGDTLNETIQQTQQGAEQQTPQPIIEHKGYGPLVDPTADAFPLHYRSPYVPGSGANGGGTPVPDTGPAGSSGQSGSDTPDSTSSTPTTSTQQQGGDN